MTTVHNASLAAGANSADLTVIALNPHGVVPEVECLVQVKNATSGAYVTLARLPAKEASVIYPPTTTIRVTNISAGAGYIMVTAKA